MHISTASVFAKYFHLDCLVYTLPNTPDFFGYSYYVLLMLQLKKLRLGRLK